MVAIKTIIDSEECYEAYDEETEEWIDGNFSFLSDKGFDDIQFSQEQWESECEYFKDFIKESVKKHEKRFNSPVLEVALCGIVELWNHSPVGGKIVEDFNVLYFGGSVEGIEVVIEDDYTITILGHHHDGTHKMGIYFITDSVLKDTGYKESYENEGKNALDANFFEKLYEKRKPIKLNKNNSYFG